MSDTPTYCPLCGTKEPHECESKPKPEPKKPAPESRRTGPGKYTFGLEAPSIEVALDWNDLK